RTDRVGAFAQHLEGARRHAGYPLVVFLVPEQRDRVDAVSRAHLIRAHAHGVDGSVGMGRTQIPEYRFHGRVIADVARAEETEQANAHTRGGGGRLQPAIAAANDHEDLFSRPATIALTGICGTGAPGAAAGWAFRLRPGRARLIIQSARWR